MALYEQDAKYILKTYGRIPLEFVRGEGSYLYTKEGVAFLDMYAGIAVNNIGHNHPDVLKALDKQGHDYLHLSNYFISKPVVNLAKLLVNHSIADKVFFANSGTEASEAAIKLARKYGRSKSDSKVEIISLQNSFHGRSIGGLSLTGQPKYQEPFGPLLPHVSHIKKNDIDDLRAYVNENTCAVFLEMVQGEGGIQVIEPEFLRELVRLKEQYDFLIVADEIQSGMYRTGKLFAYEHFDFEPDLVTVAKSLGGGLPLGALLVPKHLVDVLQPGDHGTTFGGNPLACALGEATMNVMLQEEFQVNLKEHSDYLMKELLKLQETYPSIIKDVRGIGFMIGIEMDDALIIKEHGLANHILVNVTNGNVVRLLPQLSMKKEELQIFLDFFKSELEKLSK